MAYIKQAIRGKYVNLWSHNINQPKTNSLSIIISSIDLTWKQYNSHAWWIIKFLYNWNPLINPCYELNMPHITKNKSLWILPWSCYSKHFIYSITFLVLFFAYFLLCDWYIWILSLYYFPIHVNLYCIFKCFFFEVSIN